MLSFWYGGREHHLDVQKMENVGLLKHFSIKQLKEMGISLIDDLTIVIFPCFSNILTYCSTKIVDRNGNNVRIPTNISDIFEMGPCDNLDYHYKYKNIKMNLHDTHCWDFFKGKFPKYKPNKIRFSLSWDGSDDIPNETSKTHILEIKERNLEKYPDSLLSVMYKNREDEILQISKNDRGDILINLTGDMEGEIFGEICKVILDIYSKWDYDIFKDLMKTDTLLEKKSYDDFEESLKSSPFTYKKNFKPLKAALQYLSLWEYVKPRSRFTDDVRDFLLINFPKSTGIESGVVDVEKIKDNIDESLKRVLGNSYDDFYSSISLMSGLLSGSFVLANALGESWENDSDIDVYVNKYMFENMYKHKMGGNKLAHKLRGSLSSPYEKLTTFYFNLQERPNITEFVGNEGLWEDGYGLCGEIKCIIRFNLNGTKIDLIVTECTPNFFIKNFDFSFNKIYYNFDTIHCYSWKSIIDRTSINSYKMSRYNMSSEAKFYEHKGRILKYYERRFIVLI